MDKRRLDAPRGHIAHVIPELKLSGDLCLATRLAHELRKLYRNTLVFETPLLEADPELYYQAQGYGMDALQVDAITPEVLDKGGYTGAILYSVVDHEGLGKVIPSIYYSYGVYDRAVGGVVVPCSAYACTTLRTGETSSMDTQVVIPPMVNTRDWRRMRSSPHAFTVGILTSGAHDKYPCRVVMELLGKLPKDVGLMLTTLPKYKHMGVQMAIDARKAECRNVYTCTPIMGATLRYMMSCDVIVYASDDAHYEPYGAMVVEAMALGKPVICENRGVFASTLEHKVNSFLFNTTDEIIDYINLIRRDSRVMELLGANAQMWASWQDTTVHIGKLKRILRALGV